MIKRPPKQSNRPNTTTTASLSKMMKMEIRCFQHCDNRNIYLCLELPENCPACNSCLSATNAHFKIPPFLLPKPLFLSSCINLPPFSLVLQITDDSDLLTGILHIGVTNSKSDIYDFNANGMNKNSPKWFDMPSIVIRLDENNGKRAAAATRHASFISNASICNDKWDSCLEDYWSRTKVLRWNSTSYDEDQLNCFDFVIDFLLNYDFFSKEFLLISLNEINIASKSTSRDNVSKETFQMLKREIKKRVLGELIEPEYAKFFKYISLVSELNEKKFLCEEIDSFSVKF
jgi:hypothetical protein